MISKEKIKHYRIILAQNEDRIILAIGFVLVVILSFGAGKLSETYHAQTPIIFQDCFNSQNSRENVKTSAESTDNTAKTEGQIIGNKKSHIYHLPGGAFYDKISPSNRAYFKSEEEAQKAGYRKSGS